MKKEISPKLLTPGDWLNEDIKIGMKILKADWNGLTKEDVELLQKRNKLVTVKRGIVFGPVFLISFVLLVIIYFLDFNIFNYLL